MDKKVKSFFNPKEDLSSNSKTIGAVITKKCNCDCEFCVWKYTEGCNVDVELDLDLFENILKEGRLFGYDCVQITGGEPCLHSKFKELINLIISYDMNFTLVSNGKLWEKYKFLVEDKKIKKHFESIGFSLDGPREIHDKFRGKGCYDKVLEAVSFFNNKLKDVTIKTALGKHNYKQFLEIIKISYDLGVKTNEFFSMLLSNKFCLNNQEILEIYNFVDKNIDLLYSYKEKMDIKINLMEINSIGFCPAFSDKKFDVYPNGKVNYCCGMDFPEFQIGDLNEKTNIQTILKNKNVKTKKIVNGMVDLFSDPHLSQIQVQDSCSFCRHFLNCKKNDGDLLVGRPKALLDSIKKQNAK